MKEAKKVIVRLPGYCKPPVEKLWGQVFGRLTVVDFAGRNAKGRPFWECSCSCGGATKVCSDLLLAGRTSSCGCVQRESRFTSTLKHGERKNRAYTVEYMAWRQAKNRCYNPKNHKYSTYGARGIVVCDQWKDSFSTFLQDMGRRPADKKSIHRVNNNGNYEPGNCVWATCMEQGEATTRTLMLRDKKGLATHLTNWQRILGCTQKKVYAMVRRGELEKV